MIRQIKYRNKFYIFPMDNDPLAWAYIIFRYLNREVFGVSPIPDGKLLVALNEKTAQKKAEQVQRLYLCEYPESRIKIAKPQKLIIGLIISSQNLRHPVWRCYDR